MIVLIMEYLALEPRSIHSMLCLRKILQLGEVYRVDAKTAGDTVVVGGWRSSAGVRTTSAHGYEENGSLGLSEG